MQHHKNAKIWYHAPVPADPNSLEPVEEQPITFEMGYFLLEYNPVSRTTRLFHRFDHNQPNTKVESLGPFGENAIKALAELLNTYTEQQSQ